MKKKSRGIEHGDPKGKIKSDSLAFGFKNWVDDSLY